MQSIPLSNAAFALGLVMSRCAELELSDSPVFLYKSAYLQDLNAPFIVFLDPAAHLAWFVLCRSSVIPRSMPWPSEVSEVSEVVDAAREFVPILVLGNQGECA